MSVLLAFRCCISVGLGPWPPPHFLYGRPSGAASSSPLVTGATLGDFFCFDVGGDSCLLAWRVLALLLAHLVQWTSLCPGASTTDLGVPHVLPFAGGLTSWTTSSSFSSSSTATWQLDLREFDAVEPYGVRAATFLELCCCGWELASSLRVNRWPGA